MTNAAGATYCGARDDRTFLGGFSATTLKYHGFLANVLFAQEN